MRILQQISQFLAFFSFFEISTLYCHFSRDLKIFEFNFPSTITPFLIHMLYLFHHLCFTFTPSPHSTPHILISSSTVFERVFSGTKYSIAKPGNRGRYEGELLLREDQLLSGKHTLLSTVQYNAKQCYTIRCTPFTLPCYNHCFFRRFYHYYYCMTVISPSTLS